MIKRTVSLFVLAMFMTLATAVNAAPLLWNQLGSTSEVLNSGYGPNLSFFNTPGNPTGVDVIATPAYVPGVFGNALTIGAGDYSGLRRAHNAVWENLDQHLNPNRGTVEVWYKQNAIPVAFEHGAYRIFDGGYGLGAGIHFWNDANVNNPLLRFGVEFGGTYTGVQHNISPYTGSWIHLAGVWDRDGIAGSADTVRLYLNGSVIAASTAGGWGTTVGQRADIGGGNDAGAADKFALDNIKVYDTAVTDFSNRFDESSLPEPSSLALAGAAVLPLLRRRRCGSR